MAPAIFPCIFIPPSIVELLLLEYITLEGRGLGERLRLIFNRDLSEGKADLPF